MKNFNTISFKPFEGFLFLFVIAIAIALLATPYYMYSILPGLLILFTSILIRKPEIVYYSLVFLIPSDALRVLTESYKYLTISKFLGLWLLIFIAFSFLLRKYEIQKIRSNIWRWLLIFVTVSLISALFSSYPATSFDNLRQLLIAYLFFGMTLLLVSPEGFYKTLPKVLVISIFLNALFAIADYYFNISLKQIGIRRAIGTSSDANLFSAMVIFVLPILAYWFFTSKKLSIKIITLIIVAVNIIAVILTKSRGGILVLTIVLFLIIVSFFRNIKPKQLGFALSGIGIITIIFLLFIPPWFVERHKSVTDTTDTSIARRISYLYVSWDALKEDPVIGSGIGTFREIYAKSLYAFAYAEEPSEIRPEIESYRRFAHNSYAEVLIGTGILGFAVFLALLWQALKNFSAAIKLFRLKRENELASLASAYRLSFISILIYFFLLSNLYHKYFWIPLALSQVALNLAIQKSNIRNNQDINDQAI